MASPISAAVAAASTSTQAANTFTDECKDEEPSSLHSCRNDPDFAVICAFLQKFSKDLGLDVTNFKNLQEWLSNTDEVPPQLRDMHIKLLRKTRKTVHEKSWESSLSKFCFTYSAQDAWEVERFGYKKSTLKVKLRILRELLESQFERNAKFRAKILSLSADSLRSQPIGRDRLGHSYWLTQDDECNLRIYQEHLDEEIWQVVATNREELVNLIARLRGNEVVLPSTDIDIVDEDSSSNSCDNQLQKPPPPEEQDDSPEEETKVPNLRIKLNNDGKTSSGRIIKIEAHIRSDDCVPKIVDNEKDKDTENKRTESHVADDNSIEEKSKSSLHSNTDNSEHSKELPPKKVKPIFISQSKIVHSSPPSDTNNSTKRPIDDVDRSSPIREEVSLKKSRPTLLDSKRIKKPSKYESIKSDEDDYDDDESDMDSIIAEGDENEEKGFEEDDEIESDVGKAIEDPPFVVRGEGSGQDCDGGNIICSLLSQEFVFDVDDSSEVEISETIVEEVRFVHGEGSGFDSLVGNSKPEEENQRSMEPKATFFFGEPGCLKLSPIKHTTKVENKQDHQSLANTEEVVDNLRLPEQSSAIDEEESKKNEKDDESENTNAMEDSTLANKVNDNIEKLEEITDGSAKVEGKLESDTYVNSTEQLNGNESDLIDEKLASGNSLDQSKDNETSDELKSVEETINTELDSNSEIQKCEEVPKELNGDLDMGRQDAEEDLVKENANEQKNIPDKDIIGLTAKETSDRITEPDINIATENAESNVTNSIEKTPELNEQNIVVINESELGLKDDTKPECSKSTENNPTAIENIEGSTKEIASSIESPEAPPLGEHDVAASVSEKPPLIANRKRRLTDCAPTRHSTSESELDVHSEHDGFFDDDEDDVGGKRLKMRPKITNSELRKKIEAKKDAIDETTSSSGEEEIRQRRRIISPKRNLGRESKNSPKTSQDTFDDLKKDTENRTEDVAVETNVVVSDEKIEKVGTESEEKIEETVGIGLKDKEVKAESEEMINKTRAEGEDKVARVTIESEEKIVKPATDIEEKVAKVATINVKQKPTLAEIIEKKLKKCATEVTSTASGEGDASNDLTTKLLSPPKKAPITKPLKKNLLTQLRQESSDDEAVPRKRTNSGDVTNVIAEMVAQESTELKSQPEETVQRRATPDRKTPDRQRKRRSCEEVNMALVVESDAAKPASEKFQKNNNEDTKGEEIIPKIDDIKLEPQTEATSEATSTGIGRRSGRRGGSAVVHTELPQPKRTRGGVKAPAKKKENQEVKIEETDKEIDKDETPTSLNESSEQSPEKVVKIEKPTVAELDECNTHSNEAPKDTPNANSAETKEENAKTGTARARGGRKKREVDTSNIIETTDAETPVRQSRRIAQQKIREEAERRKLEEIALRTMKQELKKKKKAEKEADPTVAEPSERSSSEESEVETKKKIKKKYPGKGGWSSGSEEQEDPEEEDEEPPHYYTDPGSPLFKSDHEFSPESDLEDESQVVPMKRARTARKEDAEEDEEGDEEACQKCGKSDHPEWILLCDNCDKGYHCSCLSPVLFYIPEGDWYCPPCQQDQLIVALEKQLKEFDELVERKRLEEEEEKRLAEEALRLEQERLEEEKNRRERRKMRDIAHDSDDDESGNTDFDDDRDDQAKSDETEGDDYDNDSVKKFARRSHASKKSRNDNEKSKRRRHDGRSRRRAAVRGARRNRRQRNDSDSGSDSGSRSAKDQGSDSDDSTSSSAATDSDDEPIYKLRKRRQINVSYRLNEYDDLINSALKKEMDEVAGAGNLGRGKDISTIIEADKEEKARQKCVEEQPTDVANEVNQKLEASQDSNKLDESKESEHQESDDEKPPPKVKSKHSKMATKKKPRKLTTLDISSEEDHASDEDFKTSSLEDEEEEDTSISVSTNSDSSLEIYRRRGKSGSKHQRKAARRAARERRKDRKFVVEESDDDEDDLPLVSKKKRKEDSDYTESESVDDDLSELTENVDSADLCDDTTSDESDGAWQPSKRKKQKKSSSAIARKSPKLKKATAKRIKRVEYSDDDISESEEEEDEEDDCTGGKGSGKQPRSQPLKVSTTAKGNKTGKTGKGGKGGKSGKGKSPTIKKKKKRPSDEEDSCTDSEDSNRRTRGRRYAYLEDFDDESSDGGIKPGVKRPDTPPEEREKFIQKQEEIKRMLAEKNSEGAKLAATPRLTPIKGGADKDKRSPAKVGDSLSTVPLSVIRQAKVLDIDYLQRKGEPVGDLDNVDDVESEFDDADLPDDLPEDMDEDAIARMVEEEEFGANTTATRELPAPDEVLRSNKSKAKETEKPIGNPSLAAMSQMQGNSAPAASGLQEPTRKRLPMPTLHPPLLRHQFSPHSGMQLIQRHSAPSTHLLQNALSAPLGQPLHRNFPSQHSSVRMPVLSPVHQLPAHLLPAQQPLPPSQSLPSAPPATEAGSVEVTDAKPRGRRKKITPLRDSVQKQGAPPTSTANNLTTTTSDKEDAAPSATAVASCSSVIKSPASVSQPISLAIAQPPQLYKPPGTPTESQPSVITRISHIPQAHAVPPSLGRAGIFPGGDVSRFYGPPQQILPSARPLNTSRPPPHMSGLPGSHPNVSTIRPTYGPPPPLRGSGPPTNLGQPPVSAASGLRVPYPQPGAPSEHHPGSIAATYGAPPPARHSTAHLNPYRPPIYGNPSFVPRSGPTAANMRPGPPGPEYAVGPRGFHSPYGYYPPPPPLTTSHQSGLAPGSAHSGAVPSSVIVSAPPANSAPSPVAPLSNHNLSRSIEKSLSPIGPTGTASPSANSKSLESRKKLTTLEAYPVSAVKSPLAIGGESSGSRGSPALQTDGAEDSSSTPSGAAVGAASAGNDGRSEFSGLVSYFSSQHDDYNT